MSTSSSKAVASKSPPVKIFTPDYWDDACKHLSKKDRVMKRLIPQFGDACLESRGDALTTLARSIVGQQISVKAAQSVWDRFVDLPRRLTPGNVLKLIEMHGLSFGGGPPYFVTSLMEHPDCTPEHMAHF